MPGGAVQGYDGAEVELLVGPLQTGLAPRRRLRAVASEPLELEEGRSVDLRSTLPNPLEVALVGVVLAELGLVVSVQDLEISPDVGRVDQFGEEALSVARRFYLEIQELGLEDLG